MSTDNKKDHGSMDETTKIIIAALAGAAVGATVALLFAPASGKETRDSLAELLGSVKDSLGELAEQGKEAAASAMDKGQEMAGQAVEKGQELAEQVAEKAKDAVKGE